MHVLGLKPYTVDVQRRNELEIKGQHDAGEGSPKTYQELTSSQSHHDGTSAKMWRLDPALRVDVLSMKDIPIVTPIETLCHSRETLSKPGFQMLSKQADY